MARHDHSTTLSAELVKPAAAGTKKPTRRGVIGALVATVAAAPGLTAHATAASADPLEAMWAEYLERDAACEAAYEALNAAEEAARTEYPARPSSLIRKCRQWGTGETWDHPLTRDDICKQIEVVGAWGGRKAPEAVARWSLKLRLYDRWWADCDAIDRTHRVAELSDAADAAGDACGAILDRIRDTPARTVAGVLVKLRGIHSWAGPKDDGEKCDFEIDSREIAQVIRDLERILDPGA